MFTLITRNSIDFDRYSYSFGRTAAIVNCFLPGIGILYYIFSIADRYQSNPVLQKKLITIGIVCGLAELALTPLVMGWGFAVFDSLVLGGCLTDCLKRTSEKSIKDGELGATDHNNGDDESMMTSEYKKYNSKAKYYKDDDEI